MDAHFGGRVLLCEETVNVLDEAGSVDSSEMDARKRAQCESG